MIRMEVISLEGRAPPVARFAVFDEQGGTVGRGDENLLALPDAGDAVAPVQAMVRSDGAGHRIANLGDVHPVTVNGCDIGYRVECPLREGDQVRIGPYLLRVGVADAGSKAGSNAAGPRELADALLRGAGLAGKNVAIDLTPEFMETVGRLLAVSVRGTFALTKQRSGVKKEASADMTMVVVRRNNPVKLLDDDETVLLQMFRKKMPGFMPPVEAMEDAYADLHAHQAALVAGMRAATEDLLARLDPQALEQATPAEGRLERMMPSLHKARVWERHARRHAEVRAEYGANGNPFSRAFLAAYERAVAKAAEPLPARAPEKPQ